MFRIIGFVVYYLVVDANVLKMIRVQFRTYYINATMSSDLSIQNNIITCSVVYTFALFELTYGREHCATIKYGV